MRQNEGYKNLDYGNLYGNRSSSSSPTSDPFLSQSDNEILQKHDQKSFKLQVALHELIGHGSGKLFIKDVSTNQSNFNESVPNPLTNDKITTSYLSNETYASKFGKL